MARKSAGQITLQTWLLRWGWLVREVAGLSHGALAVLSNLVSHTPNEAFPSAGTISTQTGLARRSVFRAISDLESTTFDGVPLLASKWKGQRCPTRTFAGLELLRAEMQSYRSNDRGEWLREEAERFHRVPKRSTSPAPRTIGNGTPGVTQLCHPRNQKEQGSGERVSASDTLRATSFLSLPDPEQRATVASPRSPLSDDRDGVEYARVAVVPAGERLAPVARASGRVFPWERR